LKRGLELDRVPRVRGNGADNPWLYVWDKKEEASAFADEVKKETGDSHWVVEAVRSEPSLGPLRPLEIDVGQQPDGWVFELEPLTWRALQVKFPESCRRSTVLIGSQARDNFSASEDELRGLGKQVLFILTGLSPEQLRPFGSFRLVDPVTGKELLPATPIE
jgi:hypothetical protein